MLLLLAEEAVKGAVAPANTPAESAVKAAEPAPATNYQLMLAHIVGGQYRSPTLGQQSAQDSPPAQKGCTYTPYLLASPAGLHIPPLLPDTRSSIVDRPPQWSAPSVPSVLQSRHGYFTHLACTGWRRMWAQACTAVKAGLLQHRALSYSNKHVSKDVAADAGILRGGTSRFAPARTPARTPATLRRFLATPAAARRSPARTPGTALSVGRGGLDSWLRRMGLANVVWPMRPSCWASLTSTACTIVQA